MGEYGHKLLGRFMYSGFKYGGLMIGVGSVTSEIDTPHKMGIVALGGVVYLLGSFIQEGCELANNTMIIKRLREKDSNLEQTVKGENARVIISEQPD